MNKVILCGRLTRDPEIRYTQGGDAQAVARYTLAVDRQKRDTETSADFINCVAFGKQGEFAEKYLAKGVKIIVEGRIQTGSYTNTEGRKVYTTDVIIERHEFCESKATQTQTAKPQAKPDNDGFMSIPDNLEDEGLPFN